MRSKLTVDTYRRCRGYSRRLRTVPSGGSRYAYVLMGIMRIIILFPHDQTLFCP